MKLSKGAVLGIVGMAIATGTVFAVKSMRGRSSSKSTTAGKLRRRLPAIGIRRTPASVR